MRRKSGEENRFVIDLEKELVYIHLVGKYKGRVAITDLKSYLKYQLYDYRWCSDIRGYVYTYINGETLYLHRLLTDNTSKLHTDHIGNSDDPIKDKLDNRACNLRIATNRQNQNNSRLKVDNSSGYKGVHLNNKNYMAHTKYYGKKYYFGGFNINKYENALIMTAYCYDIACEWLNGAYAYHNNIKQSGLLSEVEMKIAEGAVFSHIERHQLPKFEEVEIIQPTNIFVHKNETGSIGVETIS
ncbi:hypothetical protein AB3Z07_05015 [Metabacillus halosaccharovorans]|uniref:hypothetical protein n=1 Tax=Metabacillus halosaccharovorans TaxID=930124 RepID=UPI0034CE6CDD